MSEPHGPNPLVAFYERLAASQVDLPAEDAAILNANRWELYEGAPVSEQQPGAASLSGHEALIQRLRVWSEDDFERHHATAKLMREAVDALSAASPAPCAPVYNIAPDLALGEQTIRWLVHRAKDAEVAEARIRELEAERDGKGGTS